VINVHGRQVFHLVFGEAEMDKHGPDLRHGADRDSHVLAARHVPLLEEHMGYLAAARFHDQPLDLPNFAVDRTDDQSAVYLYRTGRHGVDGDLRRGFQSSASVRGNPGYAPTQVKCLRGFRFASFRGHPDFAPTQVKWLLYPWVPVPGGVEVRHALGLMGWPERLELGQGAAKLDLPGRSVYKVNGNKPPRARPVLGVDCEMRDLPGDRVDDYAAELTAGTIGAPGASADPERHHLRRPLFFLWTSASPASSGAFEVPGRGQPHLAEHSLGQW
jgi:hypothetical protein